MNFLIKIRSIWYGELIGRDTQGNRYYRKRRHRGPWQTEPRWVVYKGLQHASKVPPVWYGWLHHTTEFPTAKDDESYAWQRPHLPARTGTPHAFDPSVQLSIQSTYYPYKIWSPKAPPKE
jgi:NADH:ubiquinone oxidoreductase subunit